MLHLDPILMHFFLQFYTDSHVPQGANSALQSLQSNQHLQDDPVLQSSSPIQPIGAPGLIIVLSTESTGNDIDSSNSENSGIDIDMESSRLRCELFPLLKLFDFDILRPKYLSSDFKDDVCVP